MGKAKKIKVSKGSRVALDKQIENAETIHPKNRNKTRQRKDEDDEVRFTSTSLKKITMIIIILVYYPKDSTACYKATFLSCCVACHISFSLG